MGEISIKISLANRVYPLKVQFEEEENVRNAVKLINEKIKDYEDSFAVRDKQDLLAMCAIQLATEILGSKGKSVSVSLSAEERILQLETLLSQFDAENVL